MAAVPAAENIARSVFARPPHMREDRARIASMQPDHLGLHRRGRALAGRHRAAQDGQLPEQLPVADAGQDDLGVAGGPDRRCGCRSLRIR
jgi:hypothetical protein